MNIIINIHEPEMMSDEQFENFTLSSCDMLSKTNKGGKLNTPQHSIKNKNQYLDVGYRNNSSQNEGDFVCGSPKNNRCSI